MMKRFLKAAAIVLSCVVTLSSFGVGITANAVEYDGQSAAEDVTVEYERYGDYLYSICDGYAVLEEYVGEGGDIVLPDTIGDYAVREIPYSFLSLFSKWHSAYEKITSVTIGKNMEMICDRPFSVCTSLRSINVHPENEYYCSVDGVLFNKTKTKLIEYPPEKSGVSYKVPDSVVEIGKGAFSYCERLTDIEMSDTVTEWGESVFYRTGLQSIKVPKGITVIPADAFAFCTAMKSVVFHSGVTRISYNAFYQCVGLTVLDLPNGIECIASQAFYHCENVGIMAIPSSVRTIEDDAFLGCNNLANVYYMGSTEEWNNIEIGESNDSLSDAILHCNFLKGDLTRDGRITAIDAFKIQRGLAGLVTLNGGHKLAADVNYDGNYNAADCIEILRYAAGM